MRKFLKMIGYPFFSKNFIIGLFPFSKNLSKAAEFGFSLLFRSVIGCGILILGFATANAMFPFVSVGMLMFFVGSFMFLKAFFYDLWKWLILVNDNNEIKMNTVPDKSIFLKKNSPEGFSGISVLKGIGIIVCIILIILSPKAGLEEERENKRLADEVVQMVAPVTKTDTCKNSDNDLSYRTYVSYTYNNTDYNDIFFDTSSEEIYHIGDEVMIKLDPENPREIYDGKKTNTFIFSVFIWIGLFALINSIWKKPEFRKNASDKYIISCSYIYKKSWIYIIWIAVDVFFIYNPMLAIVGTAILLAAMLIPVIRLGDSTFKNHTAVTHTVTAKNIIYGRKDRTFNRVYFSSSNYVDVDGRIFGKVFVSREYFFIASRKKEKYLDVFDTEFWALPTPEEDKEITAKVKKKYIIRMTFFIGAFFLYTVTMAVAIPALV